MAHPLLETDLRAPACPIWLVTEATWPGFAAELPAPTRAFAEAQGFERKPGVIASCPGPTEGSKPCSSD